MQNIQENNPQDFWFQEIGIEMKRVRRELHQIPEVAMEEFKTAEYIKNILKSTSFEVTPVLETGILAFKKGIKGDRTLGFRGDMDALPIQENTGRDFASLHKHRMHACGHDGHMAMLLGLALYLDKIQTQENILLIFQPAEEEIGGAEKIIASGALERYNIDAMVALHIMPDIQEGILGIKDGPIMAHATEIDIMVKGKAGHCAKPQEGTDAIIIASELIQSYQYLLSKGISPFETAVINIGSIHGGRVRNIICDKVQMNGTIRTFSEETCGIIKARIASLHEGVEKKYNCKIQYEMRDVYPTVVNDSGLFESIKNIFSPEEYVIVSPKMTADDFSFYSTICPTCYMFLGSMNEIFSSALHNETFDFDEKILSKGLEVYLRIGRELNYI